MSKGFGLGSSGPMRIAVDLSKPAVNDQKQLDSVKQQRSDAQAKQQQQTQQLPQQLVAQGVPEAQAQVSDQQKQDQATQSDQDAQTQHELLEGGHPRQRRPGRPPGPAAEHLAQPRRDQGQREGRRPERATSTTTTGSTSTRGPARAGTATATGRTSPASSAAAATTAWASRASAGRRRSCRSASWTSTGAGPRMLLRLRQREHPRGRRDDLHRGAGLVLELRLDLQGLRLQVPQRHVDGRAVRLGCRRVLRGQDSSLTYSQLKSALKAGVDKESALTSKTVTGGRLNLQKVLAHG